MTDLPQYWAGGSGDYSVSLHLEGNQIETVNRTTLALWERVSELHLSGNKIDRLHHHLLSSQLRTLSLDNNRIATIPADTVTKLEALTNLSLRLGNNQFQCSCDNVRLVEFVQSHRERFLDWSNITIDCKDQQDIASLRRDQICPPFEPELFIVGISLLIVAVVLIIFLFVYRDLIMIFIFSNSLGRYLFSEDLLDNTKEYDVFLSYAHQDSQYVEETLLPGLESPDNPQHQYKCLIHTRNWLPGYSIPDQILNSVHTTRRTIIVLSSSYLQSMWSLMEFQAAYVKTMEENVQRVVIVLVGQMPNIEDMNENLQKYIKTKNYILSEDPWFWKKLRYHLDRKTSRHKSDCNNTKNDPEPVNPNEDRDLPFFKRISREFLIRRESMTD